jgi:hypothetical protein
MRTDAAIKLQRWAELEERLEEIKATELALRNEIFSEIFAEPKEGKNVAPLENGWKLEGTLRYNRSIDEAALANVSEMPGMRKIVAAVIKYKPSHRLICVRTKHWPTAHALRLTPVLPQNLARHRSK